MNMIVAKFLFVIVKINNSNFITDKAEAKKRFIVKWNEGCYK